MSKTKPAPTGIGLADAIYSVDCGVRYTAALEASKRTEKAVKHLEAALALLKDHARSGDAPFPPEFGWMLKEDA